jgi:hypothetical protein
VRGGAGSADVPAGIGKLRLIPIGTDSRFRTTSRTCLFVNRRLEKHISQFDKRYLLRYLPSSASENSRSAHKWESGHTNPARGVPPISQSRKRVGLGIRYDRMTCGREKAGWGALVNLDGPPVVFRDVEELCVRLAKDDVIQLPNAFSRVVLYVLLDDQVQLG